MKTPTLNPDLIKALKALRLGPIADTLPDRLVLADKQQMSFEDVFLLLLTDEIRRRQGGAAVVPIKQASIPIWCSSDSTRPPKSISTNACFKS